MIFVHNIKQNMAVFFCAISANKRDFKNTVIHNAIYMAVFCDISVNKRDSRIQVFIMPSTSTGEQPRFEIQRTTVHKLDPCG